MNLLAVFCAKYLIFVVLLLGLGTVVKLLPRRRHLIRRRWLLSCMTIVVVSSLLALLSGHIVHSPRPFVADGLLPLIPHAANNGFPSCHALLAAAIVASVGLLDVGLALPFALLAAAVDWGRVACHVHHLGDVLGSNLIVLVATLVGVWFARHVREVRSPVAGTIRDPLTDRGLSRVGVSGSLANLG